MTSAAGERAVAVAVSALLDAVLAEPPAAWHPVAWMGRYLGTASDRVPASPPRTAVAAGGAAWALGLGLSVAATGALGALVRRASASSLLRGVLTGVLLWPLWSGRLLVDEVAAVGAALDRSLGEGRERLARIVSRGTSGLDGGEVAASAVESLAENLSDSVVAPLLWFAAGGLPAAAAYRFVNTADACWGYRTPRWEHAGRVAARADDAANLVAARVTGALVLAGAPGRSWRAWPAQARRTPSPNSGWPMAAMALRLDRRLTKPGVYVLHPRGGVPDTADVRLACAHARVLVAVTVLALSGALAAAGAALAPWQETSCAP